MDYNIPGGLEKRAFIKARDLVNSWFNIGSVREGTSDYGPSWYLEVDLSENKGSFVVGALKESVMGKQVTKAGRSTFENSPVLWTVIEKPLDDGKVLRLLATKPTTNGPTLEAF